MSTASGVGKENFYFCDTNQNIPTETISVSNPFDKKIYNANVRKGSQDLQGRVNTLKDCERKLDDAKEGVKASKSAVGRGLRIAAVLALAGVVAALAAGISLGIPELTITVGVTLYLFGMGYAVSKGTGNSGVELAILHMMSIPMFIYDMATMEKQRQAEVDQKQTELNITEKDVKEVVKYVNEKKPEIDTWLNNQKSQLDIGITHEKSKLSDHNTDDEYLEIHRKLRKANLEIAKIDGILRALNNSFSAAQRIEREQNNK